MLFIIMFAQRTAGRHGAGAAWKEDPAEDSSEMFMEMNCGTWLWRRPGILMGRRVMQVEASQSR